MARNLKSITAIVILLSVLFLLSFLADQGKHQAAAQESPPNSPYLNPDLSTEPEFASWMRFLAF